MSFINKIFRGDKVIWMIYLFLCLISIVEVFSATSTLAYRRNYWDPIMRHTSFLMMGTFLVLLVHSFRPKYFSILLPLLPLSWILLIATKFIGSSINNADRWLTIFGISFQPSEIAKISLIGSVAFLLSKYRSTSSGRNFLWIVGAVAITCGIILIDNFSTAFLLGLVILLMMFIGQVPLKKMGLMIASLVVGASLIFGVMMLLPEKTLHEVFPRGETWVNRISEFSSKEESPTDDTFQITDDNFQVSHAKIAIARGGVFGVLPGNSQQRDWLPQAYSDFIYAIIIEELGLVGGIVVLLLYVILFIRAGIIASRSEKLFPKYLVVGAALLIVIQAFANMSVATNVIPVTGQPLPLVSRGGTSTLITCLYFGIILSVSRFENPKGIRREEEISEEMENAEVELLLNEELRVENDELRAENEELKLKNEELQNKI